jgi:CHC2 zinc finger/Toprim domain
MNDARRGRRADILDVARNLGAKLRRSGGEWVGPCPICGGRDRFGVNPSKRLWNCRGCGRGGDAIDLVRHLRGSSFAEAVEMVDGSLSDSRAAAAQPAKHALPPHKPPPPTRTTTTESAIRIWRASVDPRGTAVERYLASRGLTLGADVASSVIRWNPAAQWRDDWRPKAAMVCLMRCIANGEPQAVSLTFLAGDATKIGRIFIGPTRCAAVMLDPLDEVLGGLHIGEGVETCMTAARRYDLRPCWALGCAGAVAAFPVLGGVECLTLLQENDDSGRSARDCEACAARWYAAGREVFINWPTSGKDLNDAIRVWGAS